MRSIRVYLAAFVAWVPGAMRRALPAFAAFLFVAAFVVGVVSLAGCRSSPINGAALIPASQADLDTLADDVKRDRDHLAAGLDGVAHDLAAAKIEATETSKVVGAVNAHVAEVSNRVASGGIGGAIVNALGGAIPPWLDWVLSIGAPLLGLNYTRNKSRKAALAKVAAPKVATPATS